MSKRWKPASLYVLYNHLFKLILLKWLGLVIFFYCAKLHIAFSKVFNKLFPLKQNNTEKGILAKFTLYSTQKYLVLVFLITSTGLVWISTLHHQFVQYTVLYQNTHKNKNQNKNNNNNKEKNNQCLDRQKLFSCNIPLFLINRFTMGLLSMNSFPGITWYSTTYDGNCLWEYRFYRYRSPLTWYSIAYSG